MAEAAERTPPASVIARLAASGRRNERVQWFFISALSVAMVNLKLFGKP
jgi:hypothetical protein